MLWVLNELEPKAVHTKYGEHRPRHAVYRGDVARRAAYGKSTGDRCLIGLFDVIGSESDTDDCAEVQPSVCGQVADRISPRLILVSMTALLVYSQHARRSFAVGGRLLA